MTTPAPPLTPVCATCNDTHVMLLHSSVSEAREVMCTRCPTPCQKCRAGGNGPFCEQTPCSCDCHGARKAAPPLTEDELNLIRAYFQTIGHFYSGEDAPMLRKECGMDELYKRHGGVNQTLLSVIAMASRSLALETELAAALAKPEAR